MYGLFWVCRPRARPIRNATTRKTLARPSGDTGSTVDRYQCNGGQELPVPRQLVKTKVNFLVPLDKPLNLLEKMHLGGQND